MGTIHQIDAYYKSILDADWHINHTDNGETYTIYEYKNRTVSKLRKYTGRSRTAGTLDFEIWSSYLYDKTLRIEEGFLNWIKLYGNYFLEERAKGYIDDWIEDQQEEEPDPIEDPEDTGSGILDGLVSDLKGWIKEAILAGLTFLEEPLNIIKDMVATLKGVVSNIVTGIETAVEGVIANVVAWFETFTLRIQETYNRVFEVVETVYLTVKDAVENIKDGIKDAIKLVVEWIKGTFFELWEKMKAGLKAIGEFIVEGIKFLWEKIKDALGWVWDILNNAYTAIKDTVNAVWDRTKERLTEVIESLKVGFGDVGDKLMIFFQAWGDGYIKELTGLGTWTEDKMVDTIKFMLSAQRKVLKELSEGGGN